MREETVERALDVLCPDCGAAAGLECVTTAGEPLSDVEGCPVHPRRCHE